MNEKETIEYKSKKKQRLDKFLVERFFLYSRGELIKLVKAGNITVDGKSVKPCYLVKFRDIIEAELPEKEKEAHQLVPNKNIKFEVVFECSDFIVIEKPAGLSVHPSRDDKLNTLVNGLIVKYPEILGVGDAGEGIMFRPGIVHRLDKETSGLMVVARNQRTFENLKNKFKSRKVEKIYYALVFGKLKNKEGEINKPIGRSAKFTKQVALSTTFQAATRAGLPDDRARKRSRKGFKGKLKPAKTKYFVQDYIGDEYTLLTAMPKTGRMHQIRVHLASIGHPIVGDKKYTFKHFKSPRGLKRHLLHAGRLSFELYGKQYDFESQLPEEFEITNSHESLNNFY